MSREDQVSEILRNLGFDYKENAKILEEEFGKIGMLNKDEYLLILTSNVYDEMWCLIAIESLLAFTNVNPNLKNQIEKNNFIQNAIVAGYSTRFIVDLIKISNHPKVKNKLNVNYVNEHGDTILHLAIAANTNLNIEKVYELLTTYGFDSNIENNDGKNIVELMIQEHEKYGKFSYDEVVNVANIFEREIKKNNREKESFDIVRGIVKKLTGNVMDDVLIIKEAFSNKKIATYNDFLYLLSLDIHDDIKFCYAVKALLYLGANPNYVISKGRNNFIQNMMCSGYSYDCVNKVLQEVVNLRNGYKALEVNYANGEGETLLHTAIRCPQYKENILELYKFLVCEGFDSRVVDGEGKSIMAILFDEQGKTGKFRVEDIENIRKFYNEQIALIDKENSREMNSFIEDKSIVLPLKKDNSTNEIIEVKKNELSDQQIKELEEFGTILNYKKFISEPVVGREKEVKALMVALAQDRKSPIIVGESGVGKSVLVEELAYLIKMGKVPSFLKDKIIYEVNPSDLVAGCKYVGQFEEKLKKMFALVKKYDVIFFIDEIHTIYGVGASENKSIGMEAYIKYFMDRNDIKFIGTTTELEYQEFLARDALKRRFEKIRIKEPENDVLIRIINKVIDDYCLKSNLVFKDEEEKGDIVSIIIEATQKSHRVYDDKVNNPDLAISIIDKAFAFAKYGDDRYIGKENFIDSFEYCDRIYENARKRAILQLRNVEEELKRGKSKILTVDFSKFRR